MKYLVFEVVVLSYATAVVVGVGGRAFDPTSQTVPPISPFDPQQDATSLNYALSFTPDEFTITTILGTRSNDQRQQIKERYLMTFGTDLESELEIYLENVDYRALTTSLIRSLTEGYSKNFYDGVHDDDYRQLFDTYCTLDNDELDLVQADYYEIYFSQLIDDINTYLNGDMLSLVRLLNQGRDNSTSVDMTVVQADVEQLNTLDGSMLVLAFIDIFGTRSYAHLAEVFTQYRQLTGSTIQELIDDTFIGGMQTGLNLIAVRAEGKIVYFVKQLFWSIDGPGTNEAQLFRIVTARSDIDLGEIQDVYYDLYTKTLEQQIKGDTAGSVEELLVELL